MEGGVARILSFVTVSTIAVAQPAIVPPASPLDSIEVCVLFHQGWNLIGTISFPVAASSVTTIPADIMASRFFGFSSGYVPVDTLQPGFGYWIKVNQPGLLVIASDSYRGDAR